MRPSAIAVLSLALALATPAIAKGSPVVDASPEARALVARAAELLHGPAALCKEPIDEVLHAVVGGKDGAAAVAVTLRLRIDTGGRNLRFEGPVEGDVARVGKIAKAPAGGSVEFLLGGLLPFPWDSWKGSVDESGVLHAAIGTEGHWTSGTETTFDKRGLPVSAVCLQPGKDGVLRPGTQLRIQWEPAGARYRMTDVSIRAKEKVLLVNTFSWGPVEEVLPRRWTVLVDDRITRFRREGEEPPVAGSKDPFMTYYLDPKPEEFIEHLKGMGDALLAPAKDKSDTGDLQAVALAAILRAEPSRLEEMVGELARAGPGPGRVLIRALAYAADADLEKSLAQIGPLVAESARGEVEVVRHGLPRPLESPIPMNDVLRGGSALDRCWSLFFVSGDPAALRPIVGAMRGLEMKEAGKVMTGEIVGAAARWSLVSNARQLASMRECLERDLAIVPPELRPHLEEVLAKSAAPSKDGEELVKDPGSGEAEAAGLRIRPLEVKAPLAGTVVGSAEVVVENVSAAPIPLERIGASEPIWVVEPVNRDREIAVLRISPLTEEASGILSPGAMARFQVRMVRLGKGGPVSLRGRLMVRDDSKRLFLIASTPVSLKDLDWPVAEPLRQEDVKTALTSGGGVYLLLQTGGVFEGQNLLEVMPDGNATAYVSKAGRGDRGPNGSHTTRLDSVESAGLRDVLLAAPLDKWASPDPKRPPGPTDQTTFSLFISCGLRAEVIRGGWEDLQVSGLTALFDHLGALRTRLANR